MTIEGIIRMAKQAGFADEEIDTCQQILIHFAKLVAEHEREACAKIVDENIGFENYLSEIIRAKGQA
jgi:hypothetical protein